MSTHPKAFNGKTPNEARQWTFLVTDPMVYDISCRMDRVTVLLIAFGVVLPLAFSVDAILKIMWL